MKPSISVVVPVFNGAAYLEPCLESVRRQTFGDWECVVVDNASTDDSSDVIDRFLARHNDARFRKVSHARVLPMAENWNASVGYAAGEMVKLLPCDDLLEPSALEIQGNALQSAPEAAFAFSGKKVIRKDGKCLFRKKTIPAGIYTARQLGVKALSPSNFYGEPGNILFRRNCFDEAGGFDPAYRYYIDLECWLRMNAVRPSVSTGTEETSYRLHGGCATKGLGRIVRQECAQYLGDHAASYGCKKEGGVKSRLVWQSGVFALLRGHLLNWVS